VDDNLLCHSQSPTPVVAMAGSDNSSSMPHFDGGNVVEGSFAIFSSSEREESAVCLQVVRTSM
jgi:hypothetical protein